jgi:hypothetical protein
LSFYLAIELIRVFVVHVECFDNVQLLAATVHLELSGLAKESLYFWLSISDSKVEVLRIDFGVKGSEQQEMNLKFSSAFPTQRSC